MGRGSIWLGIVAVGTLMGCGDWQLRRQGATAPAAPPPAYAWQDEGTFPAAPAVEAAPASATATVADDGEVLFAPESPTFVVEALPPATAPPSVAASAGAESAAYRVQIFASRSREAAEAMRDDLALRFQLPTRLDYEAPYYKVRVGECDSESACQELRAQLRAAGYPAAYVVAAVAGAP